MKAKQTLEAEFGPLHQFPLTLVPCEGSADSQVMRGSVLLKRSSRKACEAFVRDVEKTYTGFQANRKERYPGQLPYKGRPHLVDMSNLIRKSWNELQRFDAAIPEEVIDRTLRYLTYIDWLRSDFTTEGLEAAGYLKR